MDASDKKKAEMLGVKVVETPGSGYVQDIQYLKEQFHEFLAVSVDLPFLRPNVITKALKKYQEVHQSVAVVTPLKDYETMGFTPSTVIKEFVPIGVNIISRGEDYFVVIRGKQTININTKQELEKVRT